jgi:dynein heavy chain
MWDQFLRNEMLANGAQLPVPAKGMVYDYFYDRHRNAWVPWMDTIEPYVYDPSLEYSELIIPTQDSVRYTYLLDLLVKHDKHVLMTGPTGTGKTVNINKQLQSGFGEKFVPICLTFSAQTSANQTQGFFSRCARAAVSCPGESSRLCLCPSRRFD